MKKHLLNGTILLALSSLFSRLLGVLRANRFAAIFGTTPEANAYFSAFTLPDFLYSFLIYGAISAAFVPLFTEIKNRQNLSTAWRFTSTILFLTLLLTLLAVILLFFLAPFLIPLLYPGLTPETQSLTITLLRILLLSPLFFSLSSIFGSIQTALGTFRAYALAPLLYNLSIILGIIIFKEIHAVTWFTVLGASLHALIQFLFLFRKGLLTRPSLHPHLKEIRTFFTLALPRVFSLLTTQINLVIDASIASLVPFGSLATLRFAQDINSFPLGIIGLSVATSSFGFLSNLFSRQNLLGFTHFLQTQIHRILFFVLPATLGLILLRTEITTLLLRGGAFTTTDTLYTSNTLAFLALGLTGMSLLPLLTRAFYSQKNTRLPLYSSLLGVSLNLILDLLLYPTYGIYGLAIASSFAALTQTTFLLFHLSRHFSFRRLISSPFLLGVLLISSIMGIFIHTLNLLLPSATTFLPLLLKTTLLVSLGILTYLSLAHLLGFTKIFKKTLDK